MFPFQTMLTTSVHIQVTHLIHAHWYKCIMNLKKRHLKLNFIIIRSVGSLSIKFYFVGARHAVRTFLTCFFLLGLGPHLRFSIRFLKFQSGVVS